MLAMKSMAITYARQTMALKSILSQQHSMCLWGFVAMAFNRVDTDRLKQVGPNRLCAEWILKNGGGVVFMEAPSKKITDYNSLPPERTKLHIKVVDASESSIMKIGFMHFQGCHHIDTVILHNCKHLEGDGLHGLLYLKKTLVQLQVSGCYNMNDESLTPIGELTNLRRLSMFDLQYVKNLSKIVDVLKKKLPQCEIYTSESTK